MSAGRPRACPDDTLLLVVQFTRLQWKQRAICAVLNATGVPTPCGKSCWHPSYVSRLLRTRDGRRLLEADDPVAELAAMAEARRGNGKREAPSLI